MFWKKKHSENRTIGDRAHALFEVLAKGLTKEGRIRAEDIIAALASITGELCIQAAGDFNPRKHSFVPGSRVFSDRVNKLFSGDLPESSLQSLPAESVVGVLRDELLDGGYSESDFPDLKMVFGHFAANVGRKSDWGKVPLAVPEENHPFVLPLQIAYETRSVVDTTLETLTDPQERLKAAVLALAEALIAVRNVIEKKTAVLLALQIVNGMAKTAPMTDEAMNALKKQAIRQ